MSTEGVFSNYQVEQWLSDVQDGWLGLAYDNPEVAGAYASEIFGGSYTRQLYSMTSPSSRGMLLLNDIMYTALPAVEVTYLVGWDAQYNGNYLWSAPLEEPYRVIEGRNLSIPAGTIGLSHD